ncbi:lysine N6-hydroxylase [Jatrophihabitans endophyticus]|uniref:L-lysine N6-monooxygenase MbtG n=1 Tax=Jatrophihabitans endophyticus TaxID=1206085 RepID=A0A1M5SVG6_9ACTN|nr:lysine N(6)-hydroxylase/L-ornithine N(5)-oxygenase family protein [Jatrophihabitans endophyticus]SHH42466.1 lysine N6-hydroxylase [Jatrophihabitans endophyticus]
MTAPSRAQGTERVHDLIGIGIGPFNLGLACLAAPLAGLDCVFLDQQAEFDWHPGMMLPDATLQVPFLADLVTMADPTSPFSFLAYLKDVGRLYPFYVRESFYPLRAEYTDYCRWATGRLRSLEFDRRVERVEHDGSAYVVTSVDGSGGRHVHRGRRIVLGVGTQPWTPPVVAGGPALHSAEYLAHRDELRRGDSVTVVGSGQSAAEIVHDLLADADEQGYLLRWITRSPRFFPMEYTKLTLEMTSPEYTGYFQALPARQRDALLASQRGLYKGISSELIDAIHDQLYVKSRDPRTRVQLLTNTALESASWDGTRYTLGLRQHEIDEAFALDTEGLVLATGYRATVPDFLEPIRDRIRTDDRGRFAADADYAVDTGGGEIFVQNAEEHSHGLVAPDLGMGAYRNSVILRHVLGHAPYPVEERVAFQEFGVPADALTAVRP